MARIKSDAETGEFKEGTVFYLSSRDSSFRKAFLTARNVSLICILGSYIASTRELTIVHKIHMTYLYRECWRMLTVFVFLLRGYLCVINTSNRVLIAFFSGSEILYRALFTYAGLDHSTENVLILGYTVSTHAHTS